MNPSAGSGVEASSTDVTTTTITNAEGWNKQGSGQTKVRDDGAAQPHAGFPLSAPAWTPIVKPLKAQGAKKERGKAMRAKSIVLILTLAALLGWQHARAMDSEQASKLDPRLRRVMERYEKGMDLRSAVGSPGAKHLTDGLIPCFVRLQDVSVDPQTLNIDAQTRAGDLCTARLLPEDVLRLSQRPEVGHISMAVLALPLLDDSIPEIRADQVHDSDGLIPPTYSGHTGQGVAVGIIDSGVNHQHADFWDKGSSRIISVWDQTTAGTPPAGFAYGNECDQTEIETASCGETDTNGHGTHVTGIAAGNGAATGNAEPAYQMVGTAPEADIISVKTTFWTTDVVDGVNYIFGKAADLGEPAVINLSLGTHYGPHDGWADFDMMLTNLVGKGKIIVAASGNEMGDGIHAEAVVTQGATEVVTFEIPDYGPLAGPTNDLVDIDGWYTGGTELSLTLTSPNGHFAGPVTHGTSLTLGTPDGEITIDNGTSPQPNGDENFHIEIIDANAAEPPADGTWQLDIHGTSVPTSMDALASEADMWLYYWSLGGLAPNFLMGVEEAEIVGSPASADSVIAVASYVTKASWPSIDGNNYVYNPPVTQGDISPFSSPGPRRDGWLKPDISAPGQGIFSALSTDMTPTPDPVFVHPDGVHILNQGTSMAAPHITGVVALMYNAFGSIYTEKAVSKLFQSARTDGHTGAGPNPTWGWGKVDAFEATQVITPVLIQAFEASPEPWGVSLSWSSPGDLRAEAFRVLRALDDGRSASQLLEVAAVAGEVVPDGLAAAFEDRGLLDTGRYAYWVQAIFAGEPEAPVGPLYVEWAAGPAPLVFLHPASPNPFRPNTTLQLDLARSAKVLVEIMDPAGRKVRTLRDGSLEGGTHRMVWDGRDEEGKEAASGLYFARVRAAGLEQVGRLVLIR